ncbi:MAG: DUF389 domain-containing protein [Lewinellaceae bacterium]|nr:DUF389 domain-containing protein [Saprospiraceae bacterium]MCB9311927.1 DUF389 domain-containing protein [Lewinellaceae bacterium]HRW74351.1 DUF389 domain-containing protein [Saprospiraceae bacterium]
MLRNLLSFIDLRNEVEDYDTIHEEIEKGIVFKGTNLWILAFAIVVASIGLNMNSTAVVIGAMLISPLMGPINGLGYSIATYNFPLLRSSIKNYGFAVIAGLVASTLYFAISPVATAHSELLSRTSPTIYDVMIALFGGLAGIVATSSKMKGNVIPGVAIATALMPPLCTAGYGLGTGQFNFFFGAFYLFTINTVFIALAALMISRFLRFPIRHIVDPDQKKHVHQLVWVIIVVTVLPSIYFGHQLVKNEAFGQNVDKYTQNVTVVGGAFLIRQEVNKGQRKVNLVYGGKSLSDSLKSEIKQKARIFDIDPEGITIEQGFALDERSISESEVLRNRISALQNDLVQAQSREDSLRNAPLFGRQIFDEIHPLYPDILSCTYSETMLFHAGSSDIRPVSQVVFQINPASLNPETRDKIRAWVRARCGRENAEVIFSELDEQLE